MTKWIDNESDTATVYLAVRRFFPEEDCSFDRGKFLAFVGPRRARHKELFDNMVLVSRLLYAERTSGVITDAEYQRCQNIVNTGQRRCQPPKRKGHRRKVDKAL